MNTFEEILTEEIPKYLGDSGGVYGYIYEKNRKNGIMKGYQSCDFDYDIKNKECILYPVISIYDFLSYNCIDTYWCDSIQEQIENKLESENIDIYSIWEVEGIIKELFDTTYIGDIKWEYTYNYENVLSQDIQFLLFNYDGLDYVLLQVHNGCDARSGLTRPRVFELNDIDYFLCDINKCDISCNCEHMSLTYDGYNSYYNYDGEYVDDTYIYENTYVDSDNNLRCKHCNNIIKCGFMEY